MPRYYFDVHDGSASTKDDTGLDLDGTADARREALKALGEIARDILPDANPDEIAIEVRDEAGRRILTARLLLVVEPADPPPTAPLG